MDIQAFEAGRAAYQQGNWAIAAQYLSQVKQPGEISGEVDHLLGNSLMKLGRFDEAARAYETALLDAGYARVGALQCNRGRALVGAGRNEEAISALNAALADTTYKTPYKIQMSLGRAYLALGDVRSAGVAFRNAAIDESNVDPSRSLANLGECFMQLGRPVDAIEAYRTALDFSTPETDQSALYAMLGDAYAASNRLPESVDAYGRALSTGYQLSPTQRTSYETAQRTIASQSRASETDDLLRAAGYGQNAAGTYDTVDSSNFAAAPAYDTGGIYSSVTNYDPLDPLGKSGEFMPNPEDTGFFTVTEEELMSQANDSRPRKRRGHRGLRVLFVILVMLLLLAGAAGVAYYCGYGWPTQQAVVEGLFSASSGDIGSYLDSSVSSEARREIELIISDDATITVEGIDQDMTSSTLLVVAQLSSGGEQSYQVEMVRDGISWKVTSVELVYDSLDEDATSSLVSSSSSNSSSTSTSSDDSSTDTDSSSDAMTTSEGTISSE